MDIQNYNILYKQKEQAEPVIYFNKIWNHILFCFICSNFGDSRNFKSNKFYFFVHYGARDGRTCRNLC